MCPLKVPLNTRRVKTIKVAISCSSIKLIKAKILQIIIPRKNLMHLTASRKTTNSANTFIIVKWKQLTSVETKQNHLSEILSKTLIQFKQGKRATIQWLRAKCYHKCAIIFIKIMLYLMAISEGCLVYKVYSWVTKHPSSS